MFRKLNFAIAILLLTCIDPTGAGKKKQVKQVKQIDFSSQSSNLASPTASASAPALAPAKAPASVPAKVPAKAPAPATASANVPAKAPVKAPVKVPAKAPAPATATANIPAKVPSKVPAKAPASATATANIPAKAPPKVPAKVPAKAPSPAKAPAKSSAKTSPQAPVKAPATASVSAPAPVPLPQSLQPSYEIKGKRNPWTYYVSSDADPPSATASLKDIQAGTPLKNLWQLNAKTGAPAGDILTRTALLPVNSYTNADLAAAKMSKNPTHYSAENKHFANPPKPGTTLDETHIRIVTNEVGLKMETKQWNRRTTHSVIQADRSDMQAYYASLENQINSIKANADQYYIQKQTTCVPEQIIEYAVKPKPDRNGKINVDKIQWQQLKPLEAKPQPKAQKILVVMDKSTGKPAELTFSFDQGKVLQFSRADTGTIDFTVKANTQEATIKFELFASSKAPNKFQLHMVDSGISTGAFGEIDKVGSNKFNFPKCTRRRRDVHSRTKRECTCCQRRKELTGGDTTEKKLKRIEDKQTKLNEIENGGEKRAKSGPAPDVDKVKVPPTESKHMTSVESKSKRVSQALDTGKKIAKGGISKLSQSVRKGIGKTVKVGANAIKSGYYKVKSRLGGILKSKGYKKLSKVSGKLSHAFLVRDLGAALRHGDWAGVGMMAGMTGVGLLSTGLQSIKSVTTTGKNLMKIGKGLGGLLTVVGVGFDVYAVVDSHKCESSSRNNNDLCVRGAEGCVEEYSICGGKDAMWEVGTSYAQLGLSVVSIGLLFTPAAPLGVVIDIFQLGLSYATNKVQARNQLSAFHQYFPLTKSEQSNHLGFFNVQFGFTIADKFMNMREQSKTNARELETMGTFLRENKGTFWAYFKPALQGATKTVRNEKNCEYHNRPHSSAVWWYFFFIAKATEEITRKIRENKYPCEEEVPVDDPIYQDNQVDATVWTKRYFQRWSPNPSERIQNYKSNKFTDYNFFCRPEGPQIDDMDYANDGPWLRGNSYRCGNSLGYKHQEPTRALMALFDLQNGTDVAVGFRNHPNYFVVGNGNKDFRGGEESDVFELTGTQVSGRLDGRGGVDSVRIQTRTSVQVVLREDKQILTTDSLLAQIWVPFGMTYKAHLELVQIERIEGRTGVADVIHVGCHNTYIDGRGGSSSTPDQIHVEENPCRGLGSPEHVQIVVPPSTVVTSYNRGSGPVQYGYTVTLRTGTNLNNRSLESTIRISAGLGLGQHHVVLPLPLHQISILRNEKIRNERRMGLRGVGLDFVGTFDNSAQVHVTTSDEALFSYLDDAQESLFFLFNLVNSASQNVVGAERHTNYFHIQNTYESITGGGLSDTFLIATDKRVGSIRGGSGGSNTIILSDRLQAQCVVDLSIMEILVTQSNRQVLKTKLAGTFETVIGRNGQRDTAVGNCDTKHIDLKMGQESEQDRVTIPNMSCSPRMTIALPPLTFVDNQHRGSGHFTYHIPKSSFTGRRFDRILNLAPSAHAKHLVLFAHGPSGPGAVVFASSRNSLRFNLTDLNFEINFLIHNHQENRASVISQPSVIELEPNENNGARDPVFVYSISSGKVTENNSTVVGAPNFRNRFDINGHVTRIGGGSKSDVFNLKQNGRVGRIETGGGNDVLVLSIQNYATSPKYSIDLSSHISISDSYGRATFQSKLSGDFTDFYGPATAIEFIAAACTTKLIYLDGDNKVELLPLQNGNKIKIPETKSPTCSHDLVLHLPTHPTNRQVVNGAQRGVFKYVVPSSGTEFVIHRVVQNVTTAEDLMEFEENVTQLFMLNVTLFDIEDFAADWEGQRVNLTYFNGRVSSFQILYVTSEETLAPLQLSDAYLSDNNTNKNRTTEEDPELENPDEIENDPSHDEEFNSTSTTPPEFYYNFVTTDGYKVTVSHLGGVHAVKTMERSMTTDEVFDLIQTHVDHANDLGMTIILSTVDDEGALAQFIQIGGDDEMDFLINQDSAESHLVGNTMGQRNVFYVAPTLNNHPIYVYLPASSPSTSSPSNIQSPEGDELSSENSKFHELWDYLDHRHNEGENMLQFSSLYDHRPPHVDPAIYKPHIYIPTILERDGDLVITAEYNPDPHSIRSNIDPGGAERKKRSTPEERNTETVIFVNGVEDYERLHVKLFSIFYEIDWSWAPLQENLNQTTNETEETDLFQGSRVWKLRPQALYFPQAPLFEPDDEDDEDLDQESGNVSNENFQLNKNRTENDSGEREQLTDDPLVPEHQEIGKKRRRRSAPAKRRQRSAPDQVTILSYADIVEFELAGVPVQLPPQLTSRENIFTSGDDIFLTDNLPLPDSNLYKRYTNPASESLDGDADLPGGSSIILVGMKKAIELNNLTLAFTLTDPSNPTQNETIFQLTPENITTALPDIAVAQEEFTGVHEHFETVVAELTFVKENFQSDFDTSINAIEGVEAAQFDFILHFSNFTSYFDEVNELEAGFVWIHRNHRKALRGVQRGERHFKEAYSKVVSAYNSFKEAEQSYNSSRADFTIAKDAIEMEGNNDFQESYENLQFALVQLTDAKENFSKSAEGFWGAIENVNESESSFLLSYEWYTAVLEEVRVGAAKCARRKVVF